VRNSGARVRKTVALAALAVLAGPAAAAPAAYQLWQSSADGQRFCAQVQPGPGWTRLRGPYRDLKCRQPLPARSTPAAAPPPAFEPDQDLPSNPSRRPRRSLDSN
jgi:hypothetical protein